MFYLGLAIGIIATIVVGTAWFGWFLVNFWNE